MNTPVLSRSFLQTSFFPAGIPPLWCPLITHYDGDGNLDSARMGAHLTHLSAHVKGYLIPGSTGDGWEMTDAEVRQVVEVAIEHVKKLDVRLLIGVLKPSCADALRQILDTTKWLLERTGRTDAVKALVRSNVCGFTVCPPRGDDLMQREIASELESILRTGLPIALYQLPQATLNEMSPETAYDLSNRYPNFILFKDTSGNDLVARGEYNLGGVIMLRGAEGNYQRWLFTGGGPYHGFLLSTANCFAKELHQMIEDLAHERIGAAKQISERLTAVVKDGFALVEKIAEGNAFANSNKMFDHYFAHGPKAADVQPPRLHAGVRLPVEVIRAAGDVLTKHGFMPAKGYLE